MVGVKMGKRTTKQGLVLRDTRELSAGNAR